MALPVWPSTLPDLRGLAASAGSDAVFRAPRRSEFDDGPDRSRNTVLFNVTPLKIALPLSLVTFPIFLAFVKNDLNRGAQRFTGPVMLPDGTIGTRTCRITTAVAFSYRARRNPLASFTLSVWDWA